MLNLVIPAELRSETEIAMEGTTQSDYYLNYDDVDLVETQHLTSEPTTVDVPERNLQENTTDPNTGKIL